MISKCKSKLILKLLNKLNSHKLEIPNKWCPKYLNPTLWKRKRLFMIKACGIIKWTTNKNVKHFPDRSNLIHKSNQKLKSLIGRFDRMVGFSLDLELLNNYGWSLKRTLPKKQFKEPTVILNGIETLCLNSILDFMCLHFMNWEQ